MIGALIGIAALAAQATAAAEPESDRLAGYPDQSSPRLDWLAGYWLSCEEGVEVSETWSDRRGSAMLGSSLTSGRNSEFWEQMRIEETGSGLAFVAFPRGADSATVFRLVRSGPSEAVFENPEHDFPQRVIYRREGDRLTGRIEGRTARGERAAEWHYTAAPLNARCPRPPAEARGAD